QNLAGDQDLLAAVSDGMNAYEPDEPEYVPSVSISYGHLGDPWITNGAAPNDPALETYLYRSRADPVNGCAYPRSCVAGSRRVVSAYGVSDGEGGQRHFGVRYFDGRYHRLGLGDLGFAKRIITDLDTGAGVADLYDNVTSAETDSGEVFPFAHQPARRWRWHPALPSQLKAEQIDLFFLDTTLTFVPTNDGVTYFTLPTKRRARRFEGVNPSVQSPGTSIE